MAIEIMPSGGVMVTGPEDVNKVRLIALRSGLSLEVKTGMSLSRGRSASQIATETVLRPAGLVAEGKRPNKTTVYRLLNDHMVSMGFENKPL